MRAKKIIAIKNCYSGTTQHQTSNKLPADSNQLRIQDNGKQLTKLRKKKKVYSLTYWISLSDKSAWSSVIIHTETNTISWHLEPRSLRCYLQSQTLIVLFSIHAQCMKAYRDPSLSSPSTTVYICKHLSNSTSAPTCTKFKICTGSVACMSWNMHVRNYFEL